MEKIRRTLMTNTQELYTRWLSQPDLDDAIKAELVSVAGDNDAIADRFYRDLAFGTGGLRGVIGAGTNRMNLYAVRQRYAGVWRTILNASGLPKTVAIGHDSRHQRANCSPARPPACWRPTASPPICTPAWSRRPAAEPGPCGIWAAVRASA